MAGIGKEKLMAGIEHVDVVHFTHTDFGYTDHQIVCTESRIKYIDMALDLVLQNKNKPPQRHFYWTCEGSEPVLTWWEKSSTRRKNNFAAAVRDGFIEVTAFPFNQDGFASAEEWEKMLNWLPDELWNKVSPKVAMQIDVNGFPRAGALAAYRKGIRYIWLGTNGGALFNGIWAFKWNIGNRQSVFAWNTRGYSTPAYSLFHEEDWRKGPIPEVSDTRYRPPVPGDIFRTDRKSLEKAHALCIKRLKEIESGGYPYNRIVLSSTNNWRGDNDPPLPLLADFIGRWNEMGFSPSIRFTTLSSALEEIRKAAGGEIPSFEGEWTDWWSNGTASTPHELSASRKARLFLRAINSKMWPREIRTCQEQEIDKTRRELSLFHEHAWGSGFSVAIPNCAASRGQCAEKSALAYRPLARAEKMLSELVRKKLERKGNGICVLNPCKEPFSGWIELPTDCLRGEYKAVREAKTSNTQNLVFESSWDYFGQIGSRKDIGSTNIPRVFPDQVPGKMVKFWVENLKPGETRKYEPVTKPVLRKKGIGNKVRIKHGKDAWPVSLRWEGMHEDLLNGAIGDFVSLEARCPHGLRYDPVFGSFKSPTLKERKMLRDKHYRIRESAGKTRAVYEENKHTIVFEQYLEHPRLRYLFRRLEIYKDKPKILLNIKLYRKSAPESAEVFYVKFGFPFKKVMPFLSNGGSIFQLGGKQIPGTCKDYYAIDGWAAYETKKGHYLWNGSDSALVTFGQPNDGLRLEEVPHSSEKLLAIVYNNMWWTNFPRDSYGDMEFNFAVEWRQRNSMCLDSKLLQNWSSAVSMKPAVAVI